MIIDPVADEFEGFSPYCYAANNSVNNIDPDGMRVENAKVLLNDYTFGLDGKLNSIVINLVLIVFIK
jgi:hypothetical protein